MPKDVGQLICAGQLSLCLPLGGSVRSRNVYLFVTQWLESADGHGLFRYLAVSERAGRRPQYYANRQGRYAYLRRQHVDRLIHVPSQGDWTPMPVSITCRPYQHAWPAGPRHILVEVYGRTTAAFGLPDVMKLSAPQKTKGLPQKRQAPAETERSRSLGGTLIIRTSSSRSLC